MGQLGGGHASLPPPPGGLSAFYCCYQGPLSRRGSRSSYLCPSCLFARRGLCSPRPVPKPQSAPIAGMRHGQGAAKLPPPLLAAPAPPRGRAAPQPGPIKRPRSGGAGPSALPPCALPRAPCPVRPTPCAHPWCALPRAPCPVPGMLRRRGAFSVEPLRGRGELFGGGPRCAEVLPEGALAELSVLGRGPEGSQQLQIMVSVLGGCSRGSDSTNLCWVGVLGAPSSPNLRCLCRLGGPQGVG